MLVLQRSFLHSIFIALCAAILLQGCGAERSTPFNPQVPSSNCSSSSSSSSSSDSSSSLDIFDASSSSVSSSSSSSFSSCSSSSNTSSSSSASSTSSVATELIWSATQTTTVIEKQEKNIQVMRNATDFFAVADAYADRSLEAPNFDEGQVVLIDDGQVDTCAAHLEFNSSLIAAELTDNTVKVTLHYIEKPKLDRCSSTFTRPYYFYYLKTKKLLVFEEKIAQ